MAHERLTLLDVAKMNAADNLVPLIDEVGGLFPELQFPARTISGTEYTTRVRTALPSVAFRQANEGSETTKGTYVNRQVECFILDASWETDAMIADAAEDGPSAVMAQEATDHLDSAIAHACTQFYYGSDSRGFPGLIDMVDSSMELDVSGNSAKTSVWALCLGPRHVQWVAGNGGLWATDPVQKGRITLSDGKMLNAYYQAAEFWIGLQCVDTYAIGRVKNVEEDTNTLEDAHLDQLIEKFLPHGRYPDVFVMHPRSLSQLKQSRTATNPTGQPADWPTGYTLAKPDGSTKVIPFLTSTAITVSES